MLTVGVDSFVTLAEADLYFSGRINADQWSQYNDEKKEGALRSSYDRITASCICDFDDPYSPENPPEKIKKGQMEWAYRLSIIEQVTEITESDLSALKAGPVELKFNKLEKTDADGLTVFIKKLLSSMCLCDFSYDEDDYGTQNGTVIF